MTALEWDQPGTRFYETGIDRVVLYPPSNTPVVWHGVTRIDEKIVGGDIKSYYRDGVKYIDFPENADYQAILSAFSAPVEFRECDGLLETMRGLVLTQQPRKFFGLSYRTLRTSDTDDSGYRIHLVYNCLASPSNKDHKTLGDSVDPLQYQWTIDTIPVRSATNKPTAHLVIDTARFSAGQISQIEDLIHGTESTFPTLPAQSVIASILGGP